MLWFAVFAAGAVVSAAAARIRDPVIKGSLVTCAVGGDVVFTRGPRETGFVLTWRRLHAAGAVVVTVSGLFSISGKYSEGGGHNGTLTMDSIRHWSSAAPEAEAMLEGVRGWKEGTKLDVVWGSDRTILSTNDVKMTFSKERIEGMDQGDLLSCKIGEETVFFVEDEYTTTWVRTQGNNVRMSVSGLFTILGVFQRGVRSSGILEVKTARFAGETTSVDGPMLEGVKKWTKGVALNVASTSNGTRVQGEGVELVLRFFKQAVEGGDLLNCRVGGDFVYQKDPWRTRTYQSSWDESRAGHFVTTRVDGLYTITGTYRKENADKGALKVKTIAWDDLVGKRKDGVDAMVAGLKGEWRSGESLNLAVGSETFTLTGGNVELEFRKRVDKYMVIVEGAVKHGTTVTRPKFSVKEGWRSHYRSGAGVDDVTLLLKSVAPGAGFAVTLDGTPGIPCNYKAGDTMSTCVLGDSWAFNFTSVAVRHDATSEPLAEE